MIFPILMLIFKNLNPVSGPKATFTITYAPQMLYTLTEPIHFINKYKLMSVKPCKETLEGKHHIHLLSTCAK